MAKSSEEVNATHALVFMLVGISSRYKQIVAYEFTGASTHGQLLHDRVMEIIKRAWDIGLKCNGMVSDMGGPNGTLWKLMKIKGKFDL